ncbi:MAG: HNH endonuclease [Oscillibacter sp.]|nr:HNH endonuclease [Oscillibacter sp.]
MKTWLLEINNNDHQQISVNEVLRRGDVETWEGLPETVFNADIQKGDVAFVYNCEPIKRISWKCEIVYVRKSNCPDCIIGVKPLYHYPDNDPAFAYSDIHKYLVAHGRKGGFFGIVRKQKEIPPDLLDYLTKADRPYANTSAMSNHDSEISNPADVKSITRKPPEKTAPPERVTVIRRNRDKRISEYAKQLACGKCELCGEEAPFQKDGVPYLESHHIEWLSMGGEDVIENVVALCPNCHRKMHILHFPADVETLRQSVKKRKYPNA